jgi:thiol-disulfide isomerase/thioredoxin
MDAVPASLPKSGPHVRPAARLAALALVAAAATGCVGANAVDQTAGGATRYVEGAGTTWLQPGDRHVVKGVAGDTLDGGRLDLASLRGKVVVVNFWASWCAPCRAEAQGLQAVYDETKRRGVDFVGVDIKDNKPNAQAFRRNVGVTFPSLSDPSQRVALRFRRLPPNAIPVTIVVDRQGREAARVSGPVTFTELRSLVERAIAEPA